MGAVRAKTKPGCAPPSGSLLTWMRHGGVARSSPGNDDPSHTDGSTKRKCATLQRQSDAASTELNMIRLHVKSKEDDFSFMQRSHFWQNRRDCYAAFMVRNVSKPTDTQVHNIFVVSVPRLLKRLVEQMAQARGSVHKFCSKCREEEGEKQKIKSLISKPAAKKRTNSRLRCLQVRNV